MKFHYNFIVSLSTTAINDIHASHRKGFRSSAQNSPKRISGLQMRLNHGLPCLGCDVGAYHKLHSKPKSITELKEAVQVIWDSLPQKPINNTVKGFILRLKRCIEACGKHFEQTSGLSNTETSFGHTLHCVVSVTLFCCVSAQTVFNTQ